MRISLPAVRRMSLAATASGCALATVLATVLIAPSASAASATRAADSPRQLAETYAAGALAAFAPPPGAERSGPIAVSALSVAPQGSTSPDFVTRTAWWRVPGRMDAALSWVMAHAPAGSTPSGSGSTADSGDVISRFDGFSLLPVPSGLSQRSLLVSVASDGPDSTAMRVDSEVSWLPAKSPAERIPATAKVVTITPLPGLDTATGKTASPPGRPATVTDPAVVAKIARVIDALPLMPPGVFACPLSTGQALLLTFRATKDGPKLAVVTGELTGCGTVTMVVDGKQLPTLWGGREMDTQVLKLAGLSWPGWQ